MVAHVCPSCSGAAPTPLKSSNENAELNVHLCTGCSHIWATHKTTGRLVANITPLPNRKGRSG